MALRTPKPFDGDTQFSRGMNSQLDPLSLTQGFYHASMNTVNRGGAVQTRPGYKWHFNMPDGRIQGAALFSPSADVEYLIFAVAGSVYTSQYPYNAYSRLDNIQFRDDVDQVYFCQAEKATQVQPDGTVKLITPFRVMLMQDGFTAPGVWDGSTNKHLTDPKTTPLGTAMAWSGDRLWVARRQELFASDINDPLSFVEQDYISDAKSFLLDKPIIALAEVTLRAGVQSTGQLLAFTETATFAFQASVRKRTDWEATQNFQFKIFPSIGCVAPRSIVTHQGLLWWYSQFGMTNFDAASSTYVSSEFAYQDNEMGISKRLLHSDVSKITAAAHENYLLVSVPYSDIYNTHTWVLDKAPVESQSMNSPQAWNSYWTGTRPTDWVFGPIQGENRIFHFSTDYDGTNRCWEAFSDERMDNGCPITSTLETRAFSGGDVAEKTLRFVQILLGELVGTVDVAVYWVGVSKGSYKLCLLKRIRADEGSIQAGQEFDSNTQVFSLKSQMRKLLSRDILTSPPEVTSCGIESSKKEPIDIAFQIMVVWSGPAALRGMRLFSSDEVEVRAGACETDETSPHFVRFDGEGSDVLDDLANDLSEFTSSDAEEVSYLNDSFSGEGTAVSIISEQDASKVSRCHAQNQIDIWQAWKLPQLVGAQL